MPAPGEQPLGGHWTFFTGYCDRPDWPGGGYLRVQNSWGTSAGDHGLYYMPYAYAMNAQLNQVMWRMVLS
jgi:C1A family cysteine protease